MKILAKGFGSMALLTAMFAMGCGSGSGSPDGGDGSAGAGGSGSFGLTEGDNCFDVVSIMGVSDGCNTGAADLVGGAVLVNYVRVPNATVTVGTAGALGAGPVTFNMGTLTRENNTMDTQMTSCTWHQKDTSMLTLTGTNEFDLAVTEVQSMFAAAPACTATTIPAGGTCTSTWTWHLKKGTKAPPGCN